MTTAEYFKALKRLKLTPASKTTAAALGVGLRTIQGYAEGRPIPETVALLLRMYLKHGLPHTRA